MVGLFYDCKSIILETYIICISSFLSNEQVVSLKHNVCLCQLCSVISQLSLLTRPTQWTITFTLLHIMVGALKTPLSMENDSQHYKRLWFESCNPDYFVPLYWSIRSNAELHGFHIIHILFAKVRKKMDVLVDLATTAFDLLPFCLPFSSLLELNVL